MRIERLLPGHHDFARNLYSCKEKIFALLVILCLLASGFAPRFALVEEDYFVISQIVEKQAALLKLFSLTALPEKLVSDLFRNASSPVKHKRLPAKSKKNGAQASSDYSLVNLDHKSGRYVSVIAPQDLAGTIAGAVLNAAPSDARQRGSPPTAGLLCLMSLFFFLLPRSSLSDGAAIIFCRGNNNLICFGKLGFFVACRNPEGLI